MIFHKTRSTDLSPNLSADLPADFVADFVRSRSPGLAGLVGSMAEWGQLAPYRRRFDKNPIIKCKTIKIIKCKTNLNWSPIAAVANLLSSPLQAGTRRLTSGRLESCDTHESSNEVGRSSVAMVVLQEVISLGIITQECSYMSKEIIHKEK